jgi:aspartyl protease family protein
MDRLHLGYIIFIVALCVMLARGLDRLIVDSASTPPAQLAQTQQAAPPPIPQTPAALKFADALEQRIPISRDGHYYADVEINGWQAKHMVIDTGATYVSLSYEDAASIGIYPSPGDFKYETHTANGTGHVAVATLREMRLGDIVLENVQAVVSEPGMQDVSLLGMSFLSRLSKVEATENTLALRQ